MRLLNFRIEFILYFFRENIKHYYIKYFPKQKNQKKKKKKKLCTTVFKIKQT